MQRAGVEVRLGILRRGIRAFSSQEVRVCLGERLETGIDAMLGSGVKVLTVRIGLLGLDVD